MPRLIAVPTKIPVPGNKLIEEYVGRVNSGDSAVSVAHMHSPPGWSEPGQTPEFDEVTLVLQGLHASGARLRLDRGSAGQAIVAEKGEWVRYSTPEGAEYMAICLPAFSPGTVHRDE